jgi:hypothetical protein
MDAICSPPSRHQWREGDVALLQAAAARLGVQVPGL